MLGGQWLYGVIAVVIGLHVLTLLYAYRRHGEPTSTVTPSDVESSPSTGTESTSDAIACVHCGAMNDPDYRFCRGCVADLSGRTAGDPTAPQ